MEATAVYTNAVPVLAANGLGVTLAGTDPDHVPLQPDLINDARRRFAPDGSAVDASGVMRLHVRNALGYAFLRPHQRNKLLSQHAGLKIVKKRDWTAQAAFYRTNYRHFVPHDLMMAFLENECPPQEDCYKLSKWQGNAIAGVNCGQDSHVVFYPTGHVLQQACAWYSKGESEDDPPCSSTVIETGGPIRQFTMMGSRDAYHSTSAAKIFAAARGHTHCTVIAAPARITCDNVRKMQGKAKLSFPRIINHISGSPHAEAELAVVTVDGTVRHWDPEGGVQTVKKDSYTPDRVLRCEYSSTGRPDIETNLNSMAINEEVYKAVVVGGGPAGIGVFVRAARGGLLPRLLNPDKHGTTKDNELSTQLGFKQMGVAVLHAGDVETFGGGNLGEYIINSNTFACGLLAGVLDEKPDLDPPESIKNTFLEKARVHESAKRLEEIGAAPGNLTEIGRFLRHVGACLIEEISDKAPDTSKVLLNTAATKYEALANGLIRVEARSADAVDEMGTETRVDGVSIYHRRGAALVLEALFGPEVYGTSSSFEEMVEKNEKKKREVQAMKAEKIAEKVRTISAAAEGEQALLSPSKSRISRGGSVTTPLSPTMEIAMHRRTFCGKSHLHRVKAERSSLSKLEDEQLKPSLPSPRPIRLLHESAMVELYQEQQRPSSHSRSSHRPASSSASSFSSSESSTASLRRLLEESEEQLARALAQAEEGTVDTAQLDELNARVAAFSVASSLLRASISSSALLGGGPEPDGPPRADAPIMSLSAPATITGGSVALLDSNDGFDIIRRRECQICFDNVDALQAHVCVSCCGSFCASCTRWYIEYKVLEGEVSQKKMVCPAPQCTRPLSEELIEALVSPDMFAKYNKFLKNQKVGIRFCPRAGCCAVLDEPLNCTVRRVKCQACKYESCMRCGGDFHKIPTCRRVERRFGHWKKRHNVRACPSCKAVIEKQGGCSHMKCFQCDQEFCWSCLCSWDNHDETLCLPLSFLRSKSRKYGCWAPMRVVTKTAIVGVAAVVAVAGAGLAVVVLPPVLGFQYTKDSYRRHKYARASYLRVMDGDAYLH
ncbi:hypothetical protein JG688_00001384 [Phytophthora aleatoria]|uniref:RBR-type E3 ubiquitin transferase n=1 Tax=Phytophthora aleatoria TaxID=2496075 RepID=A0A8J5JBL0_9STRA|nr:hypothetical protein JG688_00001384 [Phytophthora aleatoria]